MVKFAHSLGNMVVCSAIQDHGFRPAVYCMLNAAVPAEAVDTNAWSDAETGNPMVHHDWKDYASRTWAAKWHELFPANDDRSKLTWKGRFDSLPTLSGFSLYNFYSSGDEVLALYDVIGADGMVTVEWNTGPEFSSHAWQKQELFKGRMLFDRIEGFAATDQAGWGFKQHLEHSPGISPQWVRDTYYNAADANAATTNQLKETPVFVNYPLSMFSSTIPKLSRDGLLAEAIPALSPPIGTIAISGEVLSIANCNLDIGENRNQQQSWPRQPADTYGTSFLHSDIKNIALPFLSEVWRGLESCTEQ